MPTIVSFYQRFPNEAPPLNLSAFDHTGYTYAENFRRNERCYEAEQCEVTSDDGSVVLSLDVRIRPRGGEIEALPRVMLSVYSEGMPFQVRRMELCTGDTTYAILPDNVQQYTERGDTDGGFLETMAIPLGKVGMKMLLEASDAAEARRRRRRFAASAWTARNPPSPTSPRSCGTRITVQKHKQSIRHLSSRRPQPATCGRCFFYLTKNRQIHILILRNSNEKARRGKLYV